MTRNNNPPLFCLLAFSANLFMTTCIFFFFYFLIYFYIFKHQPHLMVKHTQTIRWLLLLFLIIMDWNKALFYLEKMNSLHCTEIVQNTWSDCNSFKKEFANWKSTDKWSLMCFKNILKISYSKYLFPIPHLMRKKRCRSLYIFVKPRYMNVRYFELAWWYSSI